MRDLRARVSPLWHRQLEVHVDVLRGLARPLLVMLVANQATDDSGYRNCCERGLNRDSASAHGVPRVSRSEERLVQLRAQARSPGGVRRDHRAMTSLGAS